MVKHDTIETVIRTYSRSGVNGFGRLENLLRDGWRVKMCNPIGAEQLEYILEKEVEAKE